MPSQNSPLTNSSPPRFSAPELVPTVFVTQVLQDWEALISEELSFDIASLVVASDWQYQEALCCLCRRVLDGLGVARPAGEFLSLVGIDPEDTGWCTCELVVIWSAAQSLEPGDILDDCVVTRVINFPLPHQFMFVGGASVRRDTVVRWACSLSKIADDLPKKES